MGSSNSRTLLQAAEQRVGELHTERDALKAELEAQAEELKRQRKALGAAGNAHAQELEAKDTALREAIRRQRLAEDLRANDALMAKRLINAQLHRLDEAAPTPLAAKLADDKVTKTALTTMDALQLREVLMHTACELKAAQVKADALDIDALVVRRSALCREVWLRDLCDVSLTLRGATGLVLAGVRAPRAQTRSMRGGGISPGVAVLRHIGDSSAGGPWAAVGGSLLWDAREREISAMRLALCAQPDANRQLCLSFDQTGGLSGR